jgi:hypothetical protein
MGKLGSFLGLNLLAIGVIGLVISMTAKDDFPVAGAIAAEGAPRPMVLEGAVSTLVDLPVGRVQVGARVLTEPSTHLILPGDEVMLTEGPGSEPLITKARVLSIDPPLNRQDDRVYATFSLSQGEARSLRRLRETTLIYLRLAATGHGENYSSFGTLPAASVVTRRFGESDWDTRLAER